MNTHTKRPRVATLDGIYILSESGFYEPEAEPETRYAWRGKLMYALAILGALGAAWVAWVVFSA